jgi:4-aminobutyrate aminotransferase / (S)-3-amino-2-methylpropionate transaminase / 5-aminovalerate transaminase
MSKSNDLYERRKTVVPNGVGTFVQMTAAKASGSTITDADGKTFIDLGGGIGVLNAGHCPPQIVKAIQAQAEKLIHACFHVSTYEPYLELCEKLVTLLPHGPKTKAMLTNTGAEAVENAIKIARQATQRPAVICYSDAFHGRSMMGMTLTSSINYKINCGPFAPEIYRLDFPNFYHGAAPGQSEENFARQELEKLERFVTTHVEAKAVAAIILELVQGEGGFNVAPKAYIKGLREFCDRNGILLIFDEVQSGFGRTGRWGAYMHYDVAPDISTWAKSMGGGMPIGAVVGKQEVMDAAKPGTIGGTYLGNPVCCAAALATIALMEEQKLNERGMHIGKLVKERLEKMEKSSPYIGDVRGLGAMIAVEFVKDKATKEPHADLCAAITAQCLEEGVVLLKAGPSKNVIRILSPLTIGDADLNQALDILEAALEKASGGEAKKRAAG